MENIDSDFNKDSGMESGIASSKDDTPERKTVSQQCWQCHLVRVLNLNLECYL